ncbi:hypothetical protein [Bacillus sp. ISL-35]|uniref:hypothetical protein n=1 Tax=Bacillus sp. ISL-35 TaxID=2819122 RepID=UPI001BE9F4BE|nr:hypothetical protein [Bacillus sp. ISL-35]MBT2703226.1 hypothetical protein [Chryseobacterium sp. ISL-80]
MTKATYFVLLALIRPNHGYQLMHAITEVSWPSEYETRDIVRSPSADEEGRSDCFV